MAAASVWILGALGSFYAVIAVSLAYRSCKPNCRTCLHWQHCLSERLGLSERSKPHESCLARGAAQESGQTPVLLKSDR